MHPSAGLVLALLSYTGSVLTLPIENGAVAGTLEVRATDLFERNEGSDGVPARSIEDSEELDSRTMDPPEFDSREFTGDSTSDLDARGLPLGAVAKLAKAAVAPARRLRSAFSRAGSGKSTSVKAKSSSKGPSAKKGKSDSSKKSVVVAKKSSAKKPGSQHPKKKGSKSKKAGGSGKKSGKPKAGSGKKKGQATKKGKKSQKDGKGSGQKRNGKGQKPRFSRVRNLNFNVDPATIVTAGTGIAGMLMN